MMWKVVFFTIDRGIYNALEKEFHPIIQKLLQMISFIALVCLVQIQSVFSTIPYAVWPGNVFDFLFDDMHWKIDLDLRFLVRDDAPLDCSKYSYDYEILSSFGYVVYLNPLSTSGLNVYARMDANDNVYYLNVANQRSLPTTVFCLKYLQQLYVRATDFYELDSENDTVRKLSSEVERLALNCIFWIPRSLIYQSK